MDPLRTLVAARAVAAARHLQRPSTPASLATRIIKNYRVTPAIALISDVLNEALIEPDQRICVSTPPRTGKSVLTSRIAMLLALSRDPDAQVMLASYADSLAQEHSYAARALVADHHELLGFRLSADKTAVGRWKVEGHDGGLLAGGILSGFTGYGASLLLVDDPIKNALEADSAAHRQRILNEFRSTLMSRLHPGASVVVIQCIMEHMRLMTADGRWVEIKDIEPGERVTALDTATGKMTAATVTAKRLSGSDETMVVSTDRLDLRVNAQHPFAVLTPNGLGVSGRNTSWAARHDPRSIQWRRAEDLKPGDVVITAKAATGLPEADPIIHSTATFVSSDRNKTTPGTPSSSVPGVSWNTAKHQWKVDLTIGGVQRFGGYFDTPADAESKAAVLRDEMTPRHVIDRDRAWFIGYMIGDGWVTQHTRKNQLRAVSGCVCVALSDKPHFDKRARYELERWSPNKVYETKGRYLRTDWSDGARLLADLGLGKGAHGKRVPGTVWSWPKAHRVAFLEGYCHADGGQLPRTWSSWRVTSVSRGLIEDVRMLALTCGIRPGRMLTQTKTVQPPNSPKPITVTSFSTSLAFSMDDAEGHSMLIQRKGTALQGESGVRGVYCDKRNPNRPWYGELTHDKRKIHVGYFATIEEAGAAVTAKRLELLNPGELYKPRFSTESVPTHPDPEHIRYERVRSIERDGAVHDVYDVTVEDVGNFVAEGFVVHNTRWHEKDLIGTLLTEEPGRWTHINIPAVSEAGIPDALERRVGVAMTSALGRTAEAFEDLKRTVGSRAWYALFQGVPSSPEGGLVKRDWLDGHRLAAAPTRPVLTVVGVDPSDSGSGDACGIVACSLTSDGVSAVIADVSAPMTSDAWATKAIDLALEVGASEIAVESFAARETYQRVVRDALARVKTDRRITVTAWPPKGSGRGGGDAVARSSALLQALEVGTCRLAGHFPRLEEAAVSWQSGQHQPDGLAALVVAHDVLVHAAGREWQLASPLAGSLAKDGQSGRTGRAPVTSMDEWLRRRVS